jgi:ketosteroid isomerase-like protein
MSASARANMEAVINRYYDGCNTADVAKIVSCLTPEATHYFPQDAPQGTFVGAEAIAHGWKTFVERVGSQWTIDRLVIDEQSGEVAIEWTHWKRTSGTYLRGAEICLFADDGRISEIRAYYAVPVHDPARSHELGDFDYAGRGYALEPAIRA